MEKLDQEMHAKAQWQKNKGRYFQSITKALPVIGSLITIFGIIPFVLKELAWSALREYLVTNQLLGYYQDLNNYIAGFALSDAMAWTIIYVLLAIIVLFLPNYFVNKFISNNGLISIRKLLAYLLVAVTTIIPIVCLLYYAQTDEMQGLLIVLSMSGFLCLLYYYEKYKNTSQHLNPVFSMCASLLTMYILVNIFFIRIGYKALRASSLKLVLVTMALLLLSNFAYSFINLFDKIKSRIGQAGIFICSQLAMLSGVLVVVLLVIGVKPYAELPRDLGIGNYYTSLYFNGELKENFKTWLCSYTRHHGEKHAQCFHSYISNDYIRAWVVLKVGDILVIAPSEHARYLTVFNTRSGYRYITLIDRNNNLLKMM